jgi:hypothetical protein
VDRFNDRIRRGGEKAIDLMRAGNRFRFRPSVALELGPDADSSIKQYAMMAGEFTNLRDRFRLTAEYGSLKPFEEFEAAFNTLHARLEKARARTLTPPHSCFLLARRQWQKGYYKPDEESPRLKVVR